MNFPPSLSSAMSLTFTMNFESILTDTRSILTVRRLESFNPGDIAWNFFFQTERGSIEETTFASACIKDELIIMAVMVFADVTQRVTKTVGDRTMVSPMALVMVSYIII